jgi:hypothetical protein
MIEDMTERAVKFDLDSIVRWEGTEAMCLKNTHERFTDHNNTVVQTARFNMEKLTISSGTL